MDVCGRPLIANLVTCMYVTQFWKISLNVTLKYIELYNSYIVTTVKGLQNFSKYFQLFSGLEFKVGTTNCNHFQVDWMFPFLILVINILVVKCDIRTDFPKSGHILLWISWRWKYEQDGKFQFWLKHTYSFPFTWYLATWGPIIIIKRTWGWF